MPEKESVWFKEGLRFGCRQCGRCCTGEPGFVWVTDSEIAQIAREVGLPAIIFENQFVRRALGRKSLTEFPNGDCVLFNPETRGCRVYESRPVQCRTWPFWPQNIDLPNSWKKTARFCKGCNNPKGRLYSADEILEQRDQKFGPRE
ncbi:MAG: YkgJ family cysteine cluster protein [Thermoguttaceae bacterium]|nr:YkgJ family cysteine cluster protein [Thermoguttaceae bacterium]